MSTDHPIKFIVVVSTGDDTSCCASPSDTSRRLMRVTPQFDGDGS